MNKRLPHSIDFAIILVVEIITGIYVYNRSARPYMGDTLVVVLAYCFIWVSVPKGLSQLPSYVFVFACPTEVPQYFQLVDVLGITNLVTRIIPGSTFDLKGIASYAGGYAFVLLVERFRGKKGRQERFFCLFCKFLEISRPRL